MQKDIVEKYDRDMLNRLREEIMFELRNEVSNNSPHIINALNNRIVFRAKYNSLEIK